MPVVKVRHLKSGDRFHEVDERSNQALRVTSIVVEPPGCRAHAHVNTTLCYDADMAVVRL